MDLHKPHISCVNSVVCSGGFTQLACFPCKSHHLHRHIYTAHTVSPDTSTGIVSVSGSVTGDRFSYVALVDPSLNVLKSHTVNAAQFNVLTFDMSEYAIGGYYIVARTTGGKIYNDAVLSQIYDKPANALSRYETYAKYLFYTPPSQTY